jgi:hypothetical protein
MAKLALTVIGMGIGFAIGGPFGAQIGAMIGGMVGNILFAPTIKGPRLTDLSVTASTYGQVIPELYGTMRIGGNMIWTAGIKEHKHKSGGKGGPKQVTYSYSASFAIAFCKGTVDGATRLWADGKLIAGSDPKKGASTSGNILDLFGILNLTKKKKGKFKYRFYLGDENQGPDSTIVAKEGVGNVPGYRGLAYLVFIDMPLEDFGNRIPQITAEITRNPVPVTPFAVFKSDTTNYVEPTDWDHNGTPDWENNAFYKYDPTSHAFVTYDMRSMRELYRVGVSQAQTYTGGPFDTYPLSIVPCFSIGGNYFFDTLGGGNSAAHGFWDANTGAFLGRMGHTSTAIHEDPMGDHTGLFTPEGALSGNFTGRAIWFRVLNGYGQEDYLYHCGNLDSWFTIWTPARQPAHYSLVPFGSADSWLPMRGRETPPTVTGAGSSDLLLINSKNNGVTGYSMWLKRINIPELTAMKLPTAAPWDAANSILVTDVDLELPNPFGETDFRLTNAAYDQSDNSVVIWGVGTGDVWRFAKWLIDEGAWKWAWKDTDLDASLAIPPHYTAADAVGSPVAPANQSNLDGGTVGWFRGDYLYSPAAIYVADLQTGKITLANLTSPLPPRTAFGMSSWDSETNSVLTAPQRIFVQAPGKGVTLQSIVDDLLTKTRVLTPGVDWDSSSLSGITVHGYTIAREATVKDCLQQLSGAYFFDGVESDYIIKMSLRGSAPIGTITQKHLGFVEGHDTAIKETRTQELELPMRVTVTYSDLDRDYQDGTQSAKRNTDPFPTMHSHTETKFELPIAMTATEAKQIADKSLKMAWSSRWGYRMKLPWEFMKYDPTDVVNVSMNDGTTYVMRLDKNDLGVDLSIETDAVSERPAAYISTVVGDAGTGVPVQQINQGGPCDLLMLNTPLLRDGDDTQGIASVYYVSAKAKSPGDFIACYIFEATDSTGNEYEDINVIATEPTWGRALTALPEHFDYGIDSRTVLTVRVVSLTEDDLSADTLESCTYEELLAGKNAAIVGDEIIQFMTATPLSDGATYELTNILRARRGTNFAATGHAAGERFILLQTDASVIRESNEPAEWDKTHQFKAVAAGTYSEDAQPISVDMQPNDLKPYTPEYVNVTDDGTDITVTFERRSRITNEMTDGISDIPYKEGQGSLAHFVYNVWGNKLLSDTPWSVGTATSFTGTVPIYSGMSFAALTFSFAEAGLTSFVLEIYEVGFVNGFSKYVQFVKVPGTTLWDMTELY